MSVAYDLVLQPRKGWQPARMQELWWHRELLWFLIWRDIKIRYRQTLLGGVWAVVQPMFAAVTFTLLFHQVAGIPSETAPYPLFAFSGLMAWMFFANGVSLASNSLVGNQQLVSKVYFPRLFIPLAGVGALLVDLGLNVAFAVVLMLIYRWPFSVRILWLPLFLALAFLCTSGLGFLFSALNVRFRDVKYAVPYLVQMGLFLTPVIYPPTLIPERYRFVLALNPMAGIVGGVRYALLGTPIPMQSVALACLMSLLLFAGGLMAFRRMEMYFADVI
jgi:homopolymeric O-antigen transport system permease protein